MPRRVTRLVVGEIGPAGEWGEGDDPPTFVIPAVEVEEWVPEPPELRWTEWRIVDTPEDEDPTYYPTFEPRRPWLFPKIVGLHPVRRTRTTWERQQIEYWVDRERGPMARVVHTETRVTR